MSYQTVYDNGVKFFNEKKYFRAHIMFAAAIKQCPIDDNSFLSNIYTHLSATQFAMQKPDEAIQSATKAIQTNSSNSNAYYQRAKIFEESQNWRDALRDYQSASKNSNDPIYQEKIKFVQEQIDLHKTAAKGDDEANEPIPIFTTNYAKDITEEMLQGTRPSRRVATEIIKSAFDILSDLPNIVKISTVKNITIFGDVHGQFHDVVEIFKKYGYPSSESPYLFNGDLVDRGCEGMEILLCLFAWKIACPGSIYLNRGNHLTYSEATGMNMQYGFFDECVQKYGNALYKHIESTFCALPLGHIINDRVFVVHGGLPQDQTTTIPALEKINRFQEPPASGPFHDILWSDPIDSNGFETSERCDSGQTKCFGTDITERFLDKNGLKLLVRSHQVQEDGFSIIQNGKCVTVFSAPNYLGRIGNLGALLKLDFDENGDLNQPTFIKFDSVQPISDQKSNEEDNDVYTAGNTTA